VRVKLGSALFIKTKYLQNRGNIYQVVMRVPTDLIAQYGKAFRLLLNADCK